MPSAVSALGAKLELDGGPVKEPSIIELAMAALGVVFFIIAAWKIADALAKRGIGIKPGTLMDLHMTRIERHQHDRQNGQIKPQDQD